MRREREGYWERSILRWESDNGICSFSENATVKSDTVHTAVMWVPLFLF